MTEQKVQEQFKYKRNCEVRKGMEFPKEMKRIALGVEYDGSSFYGFQRQTTSTNTVQGHLERALTKVAVEEIRLVCAGRTDSGVHAHEQVIHFDTVSTRPTKAWVQGVNAHLPSTVRIHWAKNTGCQFHARFAARSRTYRYVLYSNPVAPALLSSQVTWTPHTIDIDRLRSAAKAFEGEHDFTAFRASNCQAKTAVRTIEYFDVYESSSFIVIEVKANAFLQHMVRNMVGSLIEIARARQPVHWIKSLLESKDRGLAAATAPSAGLYFIKADYAQEHDLPSRGFGPIFLGR